jgi:hypothetical protein
MSGVCCKYQILSLRVFSGFASTVMIINNKSFIVGFEVLMVVSTKMAVFWVVAPCSLVEVYQHFSKDL